MKMKKKIIEIKRYVEKMVEIKFFIVINLLKNKQILKQIFLFNQ